MEAETNGAFINATERLVVVADHTKWNVTGLSSIAPLRSAAELISDRAVPESARSVLEQEIVKVTLVDPQSLDGPDRLRFADHTRWGA